ncbi:hypothetical protein ABUW04_06945 [Streptacidiphilus sp. N1-10]|uniref:Uncharacterized protein n=1 Tax=Streptacidiphilus jeojiensis TaxID=3229225 RepID=A0ABV6XJ18_9ACTN
MFTLCARLHIQARLRARQLSEKLREAAVRDEGNSTEQVLIIALLVILAVTVIGIISTKVIAKANSINL